MTRIQELKKPIRAFMQAHYTDERLAQLLCHARDGKLAYLSCCCFVGIPTTNHALRTRMEGGVAGEQHYRLARELAGAPAAENAFFLLRPRFISGHGQDDKMRRRILIPMVRCEMKRREREKARLVQPQPQSAECLAPQGAA